MSNALTTIKKMAQQAANEKVALEQEKLESRVNNDLDILEKILAMVKDGLVYKDVGDRQRRYVVVTDDMVLQDYTNAPKYGSGTGIFRVDSSFYNVAHTQIKVNGHIYSHAKDIFSNWKWQAQKATEKLEVEMDAARKRKEAIEEFEALDKVVKQIMLNYEKHLAEVKDAALV